MQLTAIFESWHIGDGNYPALHVGQRVNLSFEVDCAELEKAPRTATLTFSSYDDATCSFVADVVELQRESADPLDKLTVLDAGIFRFYIQSEEARSLVPGDRIQGNGRLALDHYAWVEFLDEYSDPPNLFYNLEVRRIQKAQIPDRFFNRYPRGKAGPAALSPGDYSAAEIEELETMEGQKFDEEFYIIHFNTEGLENERLPRTFL